MMQRAPLKNDARDDVPFAAHSKPLVARPPRRSAFFYRRFVGTINRLALTLSTLSGKAT
jgi:hypothetical protein